MHHVSAFYMQIRSGHRKGSRGAGPTPSVPNFVLSCRESWLSGCRKLLVAPQVFKGRARCCRLPTLR